MMDEIQSEVFKLCVDTVPVRLGGNTLDDFFEEFGKRICHVHLTDGVIVLKRPQKRDLKR